MPEPTNAGRRRNLRQELDHLLYDWGCGGPEVYEEVVQIVEASARRDGRDGPAQDHRDTPENSGQRGSQGVETATPGQTVQDLVAGFTAASAEMGKELLKILRGMGLIGPDPEPASERPDAVKHAVAEPEYQRLNVTNVAEALERADARADAAEAKLAELRVYQKHERAAGREALAKLDQVREVLAEDASTRERFQVDTSTSYGPRFLNRIRAIVGPVTDREEPAQDWPTASSAARKSWRANIEASEEPAPEPDQLADRVAQHQEDMARREETGFWRKAVGGDEPARGFPAPDDTPDEMADLTALNTRILEAEAERKRAAESSEEPAGETKPRTLLGWTVPDHIKILPAERRWTELVCTHEHQRGSGPSKILAWHDPTDGDRQRLGEYFTRHAHGQVVEHQADSEVQR